MTKKRFMEQMVSDVELMLRCAAVWDHLRMLLFYTVECVLKPNVVFVYEEIDVTLNFLLNSTILLSPKYDLHTKFLLHRARNSIQDSSN